MAKSRFSPVDAALEGLRVLWREPRAVAYWIAVWALALAVIGVIKALGGAPAAHGAGHGALGVVRSYGPLAVLLVPLLLALWVMNTATVYRAVLRPGEHGWHLFKLGADEARIAAVSAVGAVIIAVFGGVPAYLLLVLLNPIFEVAPGLNREIAVVGASATIAINFWLTVRLSLAPVETFAEERFAISNYWPFARGASWRLFLAYLVVVGEMLVVGAALWLVGGWLLDLLISTALSWTGPALLRRALLLALAPLVAIPTAALWVALSVLLSGCQAYVYRAILAERAKAEAP
ncbi:MAG: hypothetical protein ACREEW_08120 [Caulobacteraceae bacterium]